MQKDILSTKKMKFIYYKHIIFRIVILLVIFLLVYLFFKGSYFAIYGSSEAAINEYVKTAKFVIIVSFLTLFLWIEHRRSNEKIWRIKNALTLFDSGNVSLILSGVHTLHELAIEGCNNRNFTKKRDLKLVHDILCTFIRENTPKENIEKDIVNENRSIVIKEILNILFCDQKKIYNQFVTDLTDCVFEDMSFTNAEFICVDLSKTIFLKCTFINSRFIRSDFSKTEFLQSSFVNSYFYLSSMKEVFINETDFYCCTFKKITFDLSFIRKVNYVTMLYKCDFYKCNFKTEQKAESEDSYFIKIYLGERIIDSVDIETTLLEDLTNKTFSQN